MMVNGLCCGTSMRAFYLIALAVLSAAACAEAPTLPQAGYGSGSPSGSEQQSSGGTTSGEPVTMSVGTDASVGEACPDLTMKRCDGVCVPPSPSVGCGLDNCTPCAAVANGTLNGCDAAACAFKCNAGFTATASGCAADDTTTGSDAGTSGSDASTTTPDAGTTTTTKLADGASCNDSSECLSGVCSGSRRSNSTCQPASCSDGVLNGTETDVDCGGGCGSSCAPGDDCAADADCALGPCELVDSGCSGGACAKVCGCTPFTCDGDYSGQCGSFSDNCGATLDCGCGTGICMSSGTCCEPTTTCPSDACGMIDDGCGTTTLDCGGCGSETSCVENGCMAIPVFGYTTTNFNAQDTNIDPSSGARKTTLNCGESVFDSSNLSFGNWCGQLVPTPVSVVLDDGLEAVVVPFLDLEVSSGSTLRVKGNRPVILAIYGDATIAGTVDAGGQNTAVGAGGNRACGSSEGTVGGGGADGSGGGGGGFATAGANGGQGEDNGSDPVGIGGDGNRGTAELLPLLAGCSGGGGADACTDGGGGGGAVQLSVSGTLQVTGAVRSNGGVGQTCNSHGGGGGGGSGGAVLLEGSAVDVTGSLTVNGGNGGVGDNGPAGKGATVDAAATAGQHGNDGGGGGGGGLGRIRVHGATACTGSYPTNASLACP